MNNNEIIELTKQIEKIINLYSNLDSDFKDINRLITAKRKLTGYLYRFSVLVGDSLKDYNDSYANRKSLTAQKVLDCIKNGETQFKASLKAEIELKDIRLLEAKHESIYRRIKSQYDSLRDTLQSITQDIATLKNELKSSVND